MGNKLVLTGNYAAAEAAALCRPDLIAAYPITPQSSVVEHLAELVHGGKLDAELVQVESEHSAMSVVQGAAAGGGRVFTATSAQGLALMYEPYFRMSTLRLPMVMAIATREMTSPESIWSGQQDVMSVRDAGWIQLFCDSNQEIADMIIQGYMIAEHPEVSIPVNVCYDGFYSSHLTSGVDMPTQEEVDAFLPPHELNCPALLDPAAPLALDPMTPGELLMRYRENHLAAMQRALEVIDETDAKFAAAFGRSYGGVLSEYRMEDAEVALITTGRRGRGAGAWSARGPRKAPGHPALPGGAAARGALGRPGLLRRGQERLLWLELRANVCRGARRARRGGREGLLLRHRRPRRGRYLRRRLLLRHSQAG